MPTYRVEYAEADGPPRATLVNGPSLPAVEQRLAASGSKLLRVHAARPHPELSGYWRRISDVEFVAALRQLAASIGNGVAVPAALALLARESRNLTLRALLQHLHASVLEGDTLGYACSRYPRLFNPVRLRLIEAGEKSGTLPETLVHLADYADRELSASHRIRTALVYPQVIGVVSYMVLFALMLFVVPRFLDLFKELGVKELPLVTQSLVLFSRFLVPWMAVFAPAFLLLPWLPGWSPRAGVSRLFTELRYRLPVLGGLYHTFALFRLTRLMAVLARSSVPVLEMLRLAGQGAESPLLQAAMWDAIPHVAEGEALSTAFGRAAILPPSLCGQIAAAEATGDLPGTLERVAQWYADRLDYLSLRAGALLEPIFILGLAFFTGWVGMAIFLPLIGIIRRLSGGD
jgi:type II secretory pathway component PulF